MPIYTIVGHCNQCGGPIYGREQVDFDCERVTNTYYTETAHDCHYRREIPTPTDHSFGTGFIAALMLIGLILASISVIFNLIHH